MRISIGTFNLNNLFSRFNFRAEVEELESNEPAIEAEYHFDDPTKFKLRKYKGRLVKGKSAAGRKKIADRIKVIDVDILAGQEVEDIDTLRYFASKDLGGLYPYVVLIEGNDPRLIDLALLSKLPLGAVTSWQHAVHKDDPTERIFSRDLLEVQVYSAERDFLLTIFNNHLKSHFVEPGGDMETKQKEANERRYRQSEVAGRIIASRTGPKDRFIVLGDMNDPPDSPYLAPLVANEHLKLVDGLKNPQETRPPKPDNPPPPSTAWTHRFKESRKPAHYALFDHIWLSKELASRQQESWIDRRVNMGGDGSDHDPAWVVLDV